MKKTDFYHKFLANRNWRLAAIGCLIVIVLVNILAVNYMKTEKSVFFWDNSGYWKSATAIVDGFSAGKRNVLRMITDSMNTDYNYLPSVPIALVMKYLGCSRAVYVIGMINMYAIPFAFIMLAVVHRLYKNAKNRALKWWLYPIIFGCFMFFPALLLPLFNGRPDALALIIIACTLYYIVCTGLKDIKHYIVLGVLTTALIVIRRYFCFWAVGLYGGLMINDIIIALSSHGFSKVAFKNILKSAFKLFISGATLLLIMAIFFRWLLVRYVSGGYGNAYSAYLLGSRFQQFLRFLDYYGIIMSVLMIVGIILTYKNYRKTPISSFFTFLIIQALIIYITFTHIQSFDEQHLYMFLPLYLLGPAFLIINISESRQTKLIKTAGIILVVAIILGLSFYSFIGTYRKNTYTAESYILGATARGRPRVRGDLDTLYQLESDLKSMVKEDDKIYILASSMIINDDIIQNLHLPDRSPLFENLLPVNHVDKRDGFPSQFFDADYVVVADPIQTHLNEDSQLVISKLSEDVLNGTYNNFEKIKEYRIDNDITLKLYRKTGNFNADTINQLQEFFKEKYPHHEFLWEPISL